MIINGDQRAVACSLSPVCSLAHDRFASVRRALVWANQLRALLLLLSSTRHVVMAYIIKYMYGVGEPSTEYMVGSRFTGYPKCRGINNIVTKYSVSHGTAYRYVQYTKRLVRFGATTNPIGKWQPYGSTKKIYSNFYLLLTDSLSAQSHNHNTLDGVHSNCVSYFTLYLQVTTLQRNPLSRYHFATKQVPTARAAVRRVSPNATDDHRAPPPQGPPFLFKLQVDSFRNY